MAGSSVSQRLLLKQYIKTLIATDVVFPGILPYQWGQEFSKLELEAIYLGLQLVVGTADAHIEYVLIEEFRRVKQSKSYMHWFLHTFWREIVGLLAIEEASANRPQAAPH